MTNYHHPRGIHTVDADLLFQKEKEEGYKLSHRSNKRKNIDISIAPNLRRLRGGKPSRTKIPCCPSSANNTLTERGTN